MKGLIQRVSQASVTIAEQRYSEIGPGILLLLGIEKHDTHENADKLLQKILNYRIFPDQDGKMNLSLQQTRQGLLIVSQFTLVADTRKGMRPGFSQGAAPALGEHLYDHFVRQASSQHDPVASGQFGAHMHINLCNDGPVTFLLES